MKLIVKLLYILFLKTGFLYVALAVLEPTLNQTGLKLRGSPGYASWVLELKVYITIAQFIDANVYSEIQEI